MFDSYCRLKEMCQVVGVLVLSHGGFAAALVETAEMVLGSLERIETLAVAPGMAPDAFTGSVSGAIERLDEGQGVLVLVDLFGGTPCNVCLFLSKTFNINIVTGVNLPMLLSVGAVRGDELNLLAEEAKAAATSAVRLPLKILQARMKDP